MTECNFVALSLNIEICFWPSPLFKLCAVGIWIAFLCGNLLCIFLLSSFLQKFSLCQDRWHGEVHPHLVQPSYVALGRALLCVKSNTSFTLDYCSHQLYAQSKRRTSNSNVPGHPVPFVYYSGPNFSVALLCCVFVFSFFFKITPPMQFVCNSPIFEWGLVPLIIQD